MPLWLGRTVHAPPRSVRLVVLGAERVGEGARGVSATVAPNDKRNAAAQWGKDQSACIC